ncbi:MAG TPA: hypothetical protein VF482_05175 [Trebonia sp.]
MGSSTSPDSSGSSATAVAVAATRCSGRSESRTQTVPSTPAVTSTEPKMTNSTSATSRSMSCRLLSDRPVT